MQWMSSEINCRYSKTGQWGNLQKHLVSGVTTNPGRSL